MPFLVELKTDLKSLKYGSDRPGGGWSGQPYIQFPIEDNNVPQTIMEFYQRNRTSLDFPARGGGVTYQIGTQTYTLSSQIDKSRIKKFFEDKPRGDAFIRKQIGLQYSNPKIETGNTLAGINNFLPTFGLIENTRFYNSGKNTLDQIGVQGTGVHLARHGAMPFNLLEKNYLAIVNAQNVNNKSDSNRLLILQRLKMTKNPNQFTRANNLLDINTVNALGISLNRNLLFQYLGGPGSTYGIGSTTIKRSTDTTKVGAPNAMTYDRIMSQAKTSIAPSQIQDFRSQVDYSNSTPWNYTTSSLEWRLNVGNPGSNQKPADYTITLDQGVDKLNAIPSFLFENSEAPWEINTKDTKDIIKFVFEAISNDTPNFSNAIFFRAMLTNMTDNNSAELNSFKYLGRGETFRTYQGFDRSINFGFKIAPQTRKELKPLYSKLNHLISQVYPDYSAKTNFMRAPVVRLTIGDYIYRMPGFIESVNVTVDGNSSWEINIEEDNVNVAQLPHVIDVSVSFKPIFDVLPQRTTEDKTTALIGNTKQGFLDPISYDYLQQQSTNLENKTRDLLIRAANEDMSIVPIPEPPTQ